nr:hypothetical protein [Planctomycetota bacterium]
VVANPGGAPIEGTLSLTCGAMLPQGAPWTSSFFLGAGSARVVQFYPLIEQELSFKLTWSGNDGARSEPFVLPEPKLAAPATVLLTDARSIGSDGGHFATFPDEWFPPTIAATDALGGLVLDHAPRWQPAQRRALLDWVRRGGTLHRLRDATGQDWRLGDELAALDQQTPDFPCGSGSVHRHDCGRRDFTRGQGEAPEAADAPSQTEFQYGRRSMCSLVQTLASEVRPPHNWTLIYGILIGLLVVVGPLPWLIARRGVDARWINLGMVAAIALSTVALSTVGRRGHGERASMVSLSYAHALGDGVYDLSQWTNAFVTASDTYVIAHHGEDNLYAIPGTNDVDAQITSAGGGCLAARIPLFSSCSFMQRARMAGPAVTIGIGSSGGSPAGSALAMPLDLIKPPPGALHHAFAISGSQVIDLVIGSPSENGSLRLTPIEINRSVKNLLEQANSTTDYNGWVRYQDIDQALEAHWEALRAEVVTTFVNSRRPPGDAGVGLLSVFLVADQPPEFQMPAAGLAQRGRVIYRIDVRCPERAAEQAKEEP